MRARRGAGYCLKQDCSGFGQPFLLMRPSVPFECPVCMRTGVLETERWARTGEGALVTEVRVDFDFDPERRRYRKRTLKVERGLEGRRSVVTLQSPLIDTREQAIRVARRLLDTLNARARFSLRDPTPAKATRRDLIAEGWTVLA
ncbi:MAG: hypothetical protein JRG76_06545 [Deltaproteobacteria bacterium]|nr:hypothetical protein [Deltaproteobacteria bacterium]MBW2414153.1 hypothetical protein [Deltaproteobacteria bacterium]